MVKIFIDSGHGGRDSGANSMGLLEKNLTLKISKGIEKSLKEYENVKTRLSRDSDKYLSLKNRVDNANRWGADLFLSIHINAGGGNGFESFIHNSLTNSSRSNVLRNIIHDEIIKELKVRDRGKKKANFYVLRNTKMNAVLTESLFIDNINDNKLLKQESFINSIISGHVNGLVEAFNLKKKKKKNNKTDSNKYYRVITGSFKDSKNADDRVKHLKSKGFDSFIDIYKK